MEETRNAHLPIKKLYRSRYDRIILGVCGGMGKYFEVDSWLIRIFFVAFTFLNGFGIILYLILAILVPLEKGIENETAKQEIYNSITEISRRKNVKMLLGMILVVFGLLSIIRMYVPINWYWWINWRILWPYIIVIVGLYIIFKNNRIK